MLSPTRPPFHVGLLGCGSLLAFACTGTIGDGAAGNAGSTNRGDNGGPPMVATDAPSVCKADQVGASPLHRLTQLEYDNTVRDLVGEDLKLAKAFAYDERAGEFTANYFNPISEMEFAQYATAAEAVAEKAVSTMSRLVPCDPAGDAACSTKFIRQFGRRAYRRPLTDVEATTFQKLFDTGRSGADFANGVRLVVQAMLQSPKFIYLDEGPGPLTQHQMAARLSYFLWNAPPDAPLAAAADAGQLGTLSGLRDHAKRLLADPRALDMVTNFHTQWLGLEELPTETKDDKVYPEFDRLKLAMIEETNRFLVDVFKNDGGRLETLITAPYTFVNGPLAALYGVKGPTSATDWQKVTLDPKQRAGLFTQPGFLAEHGSFDASSPIRRGLAIRERILCAPMPVPPPGADAKFPAPIPTATTRERFDRHRTDPTCASCHEMMDKLGYAYESYDGVGRFRTTENGVTVDNSGEVIGTDVDGPFKGAIELSQRLLSSKQVQECVATQWFRYAMGRLETKQDTCVLDNLKKRFTGMSNLRVDDLLEAIVESDAFRTYRAVE
jgi:hypothetical protein